MRGALGAWTAMIHDTDTPPTEVVDAFVATAHRIVWCVVATVDRRGRPRSRILHPLWERVDGGLAGHVFTRPTPLKVAHLGRSPYVSCAYWDATHDVAIAECRAEWVDDPAARQHAWDLFRGAPPPLGYDFGEAWPDGPMSEGLGLLRLRPWRLHAASIETLTGNRPPLAWRAPAEPRHRFLVHHRHAPHECAIAFAAWRGFQSPLRHNGTPGSCRFGGHELWWELEAPDEAAALAQLPRYVAERAVVNRVDRIEIP